MQQPLLVDMSAILERLLDLIGSYAMSLTANMLSTCTCESSGAAGMNPCLVRHSGSLLFREPQLASACMQHLLPRYSAGYWCHWHASAVWQNPGLPAVASTPPHHHGSSGCSIHLGASSISSRNCMAWDSLVMAAIDGKAHVPLVRISTVALRSCRLSRPAVSSQKSPFFLVLLIFISDISERSWDCKDLVAAIFSQALAICSLGFFLFVWVDLIHHIWLGVVGLIDVRDYPCHING